MIVPRQDYDPIARKQSAYACSSLVDGGVRLLVVLLGPGSDSSNIKISLRF